MEFRYVFFLLEIKLYSFKTMLLKNIDFAWPFEVNKLTSSGENNMLWVFKHIPVELSAGNVICDVIKIRLKRRIAMKQAAKY